MCIEKSKTFFLWIFLHLCHVKQSSCVSPTRPLFTAISLNWRVDYWVKRTQCELVLVLRRCGGGKQPFSPSLFSPIKMQKLELKKRYRLLSSRSHPFFLNANRFAWWVKRGWHPGMSTSIFYMFSTTFSHARQLFSFSLFRLLFFVSLKAQLMRFTFVFASSRLGS